MGVGGVGTCARKSALAGRRFRMSYQHAKPNKAHMRQVCVPGNSLLPVAEMTQGLAVVTTWAPPKI